MNDDAKQKMDKILELIELVDDKQAEIDQLKIEIDERSYELRQASPEFVASMSTKTPYKGVFYCIKSKYNPDLKRRMYFMCSSKVAFGSWLKKNKTTKEESPSED